MEFEPLKSSAQSSWNTHPHCWKWATVRRVKWPRRTMKLWQRESIQKNDLTLPKWLPSSALKLKFILTRTATQVETQTDPHTHTHYPESESLHFGTLSGLDGNMCRVIHLWDDTSLWRWAVQSQAFSCDGDTDRRQSHGFTESRGQYLGVIRGLSVARQHCVPSAYFPWTTELQKDSKTGDEERWDIYLGRGTAVEKVWDKRWMRDCTDNNKTHHNFIYLNSAYLAFWHFTIQPNVVYSLNFVPLSFPGFQPEQRSRTNKNKNGQK